MEPKLSPEASRLDHLFGSKVAAKVLNLFNKMKKSGVSAQVLDAHSDSVGADTAIKGADTAIKAMQAVAQEGDAKGSSASQSAPGLESSKDIAAENDLKMFQKPPTHAQKATIVNAGITQQAPFLSNKDDIAMHDLEKMQKDGLLTRSNTARNPQQFDGDGVVPPTTSAERHMGKKLPRLMQHLFGSKVADKYKSLKKEASSSVCVLCFYLVCPCMRGPCTACQHIIYIELVYVHA
jgi:hypothetical protein